MQSTEAMMRALGLVAGIALFSGCGEKEPEIACCAIEPRAKCESALLGSGVTKDELAIVMASDRVCPSVNMTAERLRELDAQWPADCRQAGAMSPARAMTIGLCDTAKPYDVTMDDYRPPDGVDVQVAEACAAGLTARGLKQNELWLVMHEPDGVCPNAGVEAPRIREIIAKDWEAAGCKQFTREQMLHALNSGACRGDAE